MSFPMAPRAGFNQQLGRCSRFRSDPAAATSTPGPQQTSAARRDIAVQPWRMVTRRPLINDTGSVSGRKLPLFFLTGRYSVWPNWRRRAPCATGAGSRSRNLPACQGARSSRSGADASDRRNGGAQPGDAAAAADDPSCRRVRRKQAWRSPSGNLRDLDAATPPRRQCCDKSDPCCICRPSRARCGLSLRRCSRRRNHHSATMRHQNRVQEDKTPVTSATGVRTAFNQPDRFRRVALRPRYRLPACRQRAAWTRSISVVAAVCRR